MQKILLIENQPTIEYEQRHNPQCGENTLRVTHQLPPVCRNSLDTGFS